MKTLKFSLFFVIFLLVNFSLSAQTIVGTWTFKPSSLEDGYELGTMKLHPDGRYYMIWNYGYDITEQDFGTYQVQGQNITFNTYQSNNTVSYQIAALKNQTMQFYLPSESRTWTYHLHSKNVEFNEIALNNFKSFENHARVNGLWQFNGGKVKFLPAHSITFIYIGDQFYWGTYSFSGNDLTIKEISADENTMYSGKMMHFTDKQFQLFDNNTKENVAYQYLGTTELSPNEITLISEYLNTMHRINMSIIGGIGNSSWIWKKVDKYGNVIE